MATLTTADPRFTWYATTPVQFRGRRRSLANSRLASALVLGSDAIRLPSATRRRASGLRPNALSRFIRLAMLVLLAKTPHEPICPSPTP